MSISDGARAHKLTERQRRFVEAFMGACAGNGTEAARRAGYSGSDETLAAVAHRNLKRAGVQAAMAQRIADDPMVKGREDMQRWWSRVMGDASVKMRDRLKASELLAKSQGLFIDRVEHKIDGASKVTFYLPDNGRRPPVEDAEPAGTT